MISQTESSTLQFGKEFAETLEKGSVLALHGDLGAGKTTLAKGIISSITGQPTHQISSPTFTYVNPYESDLFPIYHFDLYRLKNVDAFIEMGFLDYFDDEGICIIEWPERISRLLPSKTLHIRLTTEDQGRRIDVHKG